MNPFWLDVDDRLSVREVLWVDDERVVYRATRGSEQPTVLAVCAASKSPVPDFLDRLAHEYAMRDILDDAWAARPLDLMQVGEQTVLVLRDPGGEPLDRLIGSPMDIGQFLRLAVALSGALGRLHEHGLIHKDIKPTDALVDFETGHCWLTGFGITSRLPAHRSPEPSESIAGTFAYMAPEQTGRMNRSIDSRSDLYSLGITFYQMLTGVLPFMASDPMEWIHRHVARSPVVPHERIQNIPPAVSALVMRLLAKSAEERYQTAAGLLNDLRRCLLDWESHGRIKEFPLGSRDTPSRLQISEKLYGRESETKSLLASFDRVVATGIPKLVLVSGYSGIGKSSLVNELHRALVPLRGLFASGKFDQYKRDIPYSPLAQALQSLVRSLLGKNDADLCFWRDNFRQALGLNGLLIVDLVPELKLIIGEQPPVAVLSPQDAQRRFHLVLRRFINVFARPEHPLALFLDDLHWLDAATVDVLEELLTQSDLSNLLLIGAYRDNEVDANHPLMRKLEAIRRSGAAVQEIALAPLTSGNVERLVEDSLRAPRSRVAPLARRLHDKAAGNPFFTIQLLFSLVEKQLLTFHHHRGQWSWNVSQIDAQGYTDNVVDLMVEKVIRLPNETQAALQQLACLGNSTHIGVLSMVYEDTEEELRVKLLDALQAGLIVRSGDSINFVHDRVQEAAYSLIPTESRSTTHLRIGRLLLAHTPVELRDEAIFDIVNQLNRGAAMITSRDEKEHLAELNLMAGKRAKICTAYISALEYFVAGSSLLAEDSLERLHDLSFTLELQRAECELLSDQLSASADRLLMLASRAKNEIEQAAIACLQVDLYTILDRSDRAVAVSLAYLRRVGVEWSPHPTYAEVRRTYDRIHSMLGSHGIEALASSPLMRDPVSLATMDLLTRVMSAAYFTDENLSSMIICHMVDLSLEHGICDGSCFAIVWFAVISGPRFNEYRIGFRFGQLGYDLVEKHGLKRWQARTYMCFGNMVMPWAKHVSLGRGLVRRAFYAANDIGDLTFAAYSCNHLVTNLLAAGDDLAEVQREAEKGLEFARKLGFGLIVDDITAQLQLVLTLRGSTAMFGFFDDGTFAESKFEQHLSSGSVAAEAECWYSIRKLQARFLAGHYQSAVDAALRAQPLLWTSPSQFETAEFHFYGALARAALWTTASPDQRGHHLDALTAHRRQLDLWAQHCPENFENRAALVGAEIARIEGRELLAEQLYEQAIRSARANGFVHNEAIASECAARFFLDRGFEMISDAYMRNARYCYVRWGADGKVRQLDRLPSQLGGVRPVAATDTIKTSVEHLELATVIHVSEAVSREIVPERLLDTLMRTAIAQAGADRGLLVLRRGSEPYVAAEATARGDSVFVHVANLATATLLPESVLNYSLRTEDSIILDNAATDPRFADDLYIRDQQSRSILCLPLITRGKMIGVLYLENSLAHGVFTPSRLPVLKFLASQTAIALENAHLYHDLAQREARIRRLVEAGIIGICIWDIDGRFLETNDAFLRMTGYDHEEIVGGRIRWTDMERDSDSGQMRAHAAAGQLRPYESELLRKDGSRVPVLIGATALGDDGDECVAFVLDLTERKQAEATAREIELRYREMQTELAHANRAATMGQLSASIAHEINQPITAAITYADAALRWLSAKPPNLDEVREALALISEGGVRAGQVIDRVRALIKKTPTRKDELEINEVLLEVIALLRHETEKDGIFVRTELGEGLPVVRGDRIQLQQVILNLTINAIQAMRATTNEPRELKLETAMTAAGVRVTISDSGPGLTPTSVERLFEAFYTTKPEGLGMGLSISRAIIEAHRGRLWAADQTTRGAVIHFTLPPYSASFQ